MPVITIVKRDADFIAKTLQTWKKENDEWNLCQHVIITNGVISVKWNDFISVLKIK